MSHDDKVSNLSNNRVFQDIVSTRYSRRRILSGGLTAAVGTFFAGSSVSALANTVNRATSGARGSLINFTPVPVADGNGPWPTISPEYQWQVLIPWGTPLQPDGPAFVYPPSPEQQMQQVGIGHDGMAYFSLSGRGGFMNRSDRGLLCINHEFGRNSHVLGKPSPESLDDVRVSQSAHGVSVVEIARINGEWQTVQSDYSRRITVNTPVTFSGPVAGSPLLDTPAGNAPAGTVNNCGNGRTPWGTYLTCEENFNGYFGSTEGDGFTPTIEQDRYGFDFDGFGYGWEAFDERFDLSNSQYLNEENRFGWIVEIDPRNPASAPIKRTALGRFKHESVALTIGQDGRAVAYMGDDQRFDYIYKFVSDQHYKKMLSQGVSPLDEGSLYVARFNEDGSGDWLELTIDNPLLAERFNNQAEVLTFARISADILGATPMDRPEWASVAPDGTVYCTLTNNSQRVEPNAANPLAPNADGHIIRWTDADDHVGLTFNWDIFILSQDTHGTDSTFSDPDAIYADPDGRLFIQTDGGQKEGLNNQMLVADLNTGEIKRLFTGVTGDEITGITMTPDRRTMFINTQHPGNGDPSLTNFPEPFNGSTVPRDATIVITRKDNGIIGS